MCSLPDRIIHTDAGPAIHLQKTLDFALKINDDPKSVTDDDVLALKAAGYTDKGVIQIVHLVSDFGCYNKLNLSMGTDYDYAKFGSKG